MKTPLKNEEIIKKQQRINKEEWERELLMRTQVEPLGLGASSAYWSCQQRMDRIRFKDIYQYAKGPCPGLDYD